MLLTWLLLVGGCALFPRSNASTTNITNLTFVTEILTWNDAHHACQEIDGHLVQITDETKYEAVKDVWLKFRGNLSSTGLWIGVVYSSPENFVLSESCSPTSWTNWGDNGPGTSHCARLNHGSFEWKGAPCNREKFYMCEQKTDEPCPYKMITPATLSFDFLSLVEEGRNTTTCQTWCDSHVHKDLRCWAFHHIPPDLCRGFFAEHDIALSSVREHHSYILFIKQCFKGFVRHSIYKPVTPNMSRFTQVCAEFLTNFTVPSTTNQSRYVSTSGTPTTTTTSDAGMHFVSTGSFTSENPWYSSPSAVNYAKLTSPSASKWEIETTTPFHNTRSLPASRNSLTTTMGGDDSPSASFYRAEDRSSTGGTFPKTTTAILGETPIFATFQIQDQPSTAAEQIPQRSTAPGSHVHDKSCKISPFPL